MVTKMMLLKTFLWLTNHVSALVEPLVEVGEVEGQEGNDVREGGSLWYDKYFLSDPSPIIGYACQ